MLQLEIPKKGCDSNMLFIWIISKAFLNGKYLEYHTNNAGLLVWTQIWVKYGQTQMLG